LTRPALALTLPLVLVLHALFVLALWYEMQPNKSPHLAVAHIDIDQVLTVRLIDHSSEPRAAQPPEPPTLPKLVPPQQEVTPASAP
jgi:hypothetical protein